jgi:hypothetical protein
VIGVDPCIKFNGLKTPYGLDNVTLLHAMKKIDRFTNPPPSLAETRLVHLFRGALETVHIEDANLLLMMCDGERVLSGLTAELYDQYLK